MIITFQSFLRDEIMTSLNEPMFSLFEFLSFVGAICIAFQFSILVEELIGNHIGHFAWYFCLAFFTLGVIRDRVALGYGQLSSPAVSSKGSQVVTKDDNDDDYYLYDDVDDDDDDTIALSAKPMNPPKVSPSRKNKKKNSTPKKETPRSSMQSPSRTSSSRNSTKSKKILLQQARERAQQYGEDDKQRLEAIKRRKTGQE